MERQLRMGGGIMNAMPRQQYGLGSFVKKAVKGVTGAVKKFAKSDLGKAALIGAAGFGIPGTQFGGLFGRAGIGGAATGLFGKAGIGATLSGIPGASTVSNFLGGEKTLGKTLGVMAGGSLLGGLLAKAEAGDEEAVAATRDVNSLRSYLDSGYRNLGYPEDEIPALVEQGVSEYSSSQGGYANGGRIGFNNGSEDYGKLIDAYERGIDVMPGESLTDYINRIRESERKNSAMGGRMQYGLGSLVRGSGVFQPVSASMNAGDTPVMPSSGMGGMLSKLINSNPDIFKKLRSSSSSNFIDENFNGIDDRQEVAYGGRIGYAFGTPEQNAIQASQMEGLPLNQNPAGVTELDLRETGGFIPPVGVKEKADDIPAMLANNEFVFTADAVRGMGDGNVNKGAQRMYDMMKKLEKGGRV